MNPTLKKVLSYLIPLVLGLGLLNWVFNEVDLKQTLEEFKNANYVYVGLAAVLALIAHVLRAARWSYMLQPLGYNASLYNSTIAVLIGYLTNLIFPRAGEVARSVSLQKSENVPFDKSFGAVIAERLVDVLTLFILMGLNLIFEYDRIIGLVKEFFPDFQLGWLFGIVVIALVLGGFLFFKFKDRIFELPILNKFKAFFEGLKDGFVSVLNLKNPWVFIAQSFGIWVLYYLSSMLLCYSVEIGLSLSPLAILTILVMGTIGMAVPTFGGLGSYHLLVGKIVLLYGLSNQDGISLATFLHTMNGIFFVIIFGVIALLLSTFSKSKTSSD